MPLTLLPAVDVSDGQAIRLVQGDVGSATSNGPALAAALAWQADGAEWIHLVDLDAAYGRGSNAEVLATIVGSLDVKVELAGGIRDDESLNRALAISCERVVLASTALVDSGWCTQVIKQFGGRVAVSVDVRTVDEADETIRYRIAPRGAIAQVGDASDLWETLGWLDQAGCARYIITDVKRDGMLLGPNVDLYREVTQRTSASVIASGGISTINDLLDLAALAATNPNLEGSIVGKALYAGRFTLPEASKAMRAYQ